MALLVRVLAAAALLLLLFWLFRLAMGLRWSKVVRERDRRELESRGRRLVAELPRAAGDLTLFVEDAAGFRWGEQLVDKAELEGVRLLVNGRAVDSSARRGAALPPLEGHEEYEGRERWDVLLYLRGGRTLEIACGTLREGVSREAAQRVFAALARTLEEEGRP